MVEQLYFCFAHIELIVHGFSSMLVRWLIAIAAAVEVEAIKR